MSEILLIFQIYNESENAREASMHDAIDLNVAKVITFLLAAANAQLDIYIYSGQ